MEDNINYRKMKQKYLREQLQANKWDPMEFSEFIGDKKENG